jgi:hypothetical protein
MAKAERFNDSRLLDSGLEAADDSIRREMPLKIRLTPTQHHPSVQHAWLATIGSQVTGCVLVSLHDSRATPHHQRRHHRTLRHDAPE